MKMFHRLFAIVIFTLSFSSHALAQSLPVTTPEEVGLSSDRLDRISTVMQSYVDENRIAGGAGIIMRNGKVAYHHAFGMADREAGKSMETDNIFRIASMSKAITSLAVMMLYEEGHFLLDDPVSRYIPAFDREMEVLVPGDSEKTPYELEPAREPITIRHLLTHTSGITYGFIGQDHIADIYKESGISDGLIETKGEIGDMVKKLASLPLIKQPGEAWQYGLSTDVLGYLVEIVSDKPLDRFFRERIFDPLNMHDSYFYIPENKLQRLASVYTPTDNGDIEKLSSKRVETGPVLFSTTYNYNGPGTYFSGGAGLVSTTTDYARFLQMLLNGGILDGTRILSPKTIELMTSNQIGELDIGNPGMKFGLGFSIDSGPGYSGQIGSPGIYAWGGFFNTTYWVDPEENIVAVFMTQQYPNNDVDILDKFRVMTYQAVVE